MKTLAARALYFIGDIACHCRCYRIYSAAMNASFKLDTESRIWTKP